MSPVVLAAAGVARTYGRGRGAVVAVRHATLALRAGEIVGVHGASGSGKSTLLRLLAGIEQPSAGMVAPRRPAPGAVMPVLQDPVGSLDPRWPLWRTVTEPLTAPHRHGWRMPRDARRAAAAARLATVGLEGVDVDALPGELSRGQCQRVALLRALAADPAVVLADEPTSALDVSVAAGLLALLAATAARGTALLVVSHDRAMLDVLCDRVLHLRDGVLSPSAEG